MNKTIDELTFTDDGMFLSKIAYVTSCRLAIGNYINKAHSAFAKWALGHLRFELRTKGL